MKATLANITWHLRKCEHCDGAGMRQGRIHCRGCGGHGYIRSRTGEAMAQYQREWRAKQTQCQSSEKKVSESAK